MRFHLPNIENYNRYRTVRAITTLTPRLHLMYTYCALMLQQLQATLVTQLHTGHWPFSTVGGLHS